MSALIVLDTNVLVSGLLSERGAPAQILDLIRGLEIDLVADERILEEYREVTARPELRMEAALVEDVLALIGEICRIVRAPPWPLELPDSDDGVFLSAAHVSGAVLVTGNMRHFPEKLRRGVSVLTPREFLTSHASR